MLIEQFYDSALAHAYYGIISEGQMAVIDPPRDAAALYNLADKHQATIVAVIETHPHADFVSSHTEIARKTGATIYVSKIYGAGYKHQGFDDGDQLTLGALTLEAINTPGHSPDSICVLLKDAKGEPQALFSGDTLFIGDVGRPDLRESAGNVQAKREELARDMYRSTREKLMKLPEHILVYPAHGAGSLCGKALSAETSSTLGAQLRENYALQPMDEQTFVANLLADQPFIPKYFGFDVDLNRAGAADLQPNLDAIDYKEGTAIPGDALVIDLRESAAYRKGHIPGSLNIVDCQKFETWFGAIVAPDERFYLVGESREQLETQIRRIAKIGYEQHIIAAVVNPKGMTDTLPETDIAEFKRNPEAYRVVDIRNTGEVQNGKLFDFAMTIPLPELRERWQEIPTDQPIMIHCAGGFRSAMGASILKANNPEARVYDLGFAITDFQVMPA